LKLFFKADSLYSSFTKSPSNWGFSNVNVQITVSLLGSRLDIMKLGFNSIALAIQAVSCEWGLFPAGVPAEGSAGTGTQRSRKGSSKQLSVSGISG